jgi:hypothetical protein
MQEMKQPERPEKHAHRCTCHPRKEDKVNAAPALRHAQRELIGDAVIQSEMHFVWTAACVILNRTGNSEVMREL